MERKADQEILDRELEMQGKLRGNTSISIHHVKTIGRPAILFLRERHRENFLKYFDVSLKYKNICEHESVQTLVEQSLDFQEIKNNDMF